MKLEGELDKREILTRYLNEIYFGRGAYGVEAASRAYFGVGVENLQLHQAAYLAGLIRAPERADGVRDPEEATRRRDHACSPAWWRRATSPRRRPTLAGAVPWVWAPTAADGTPQDVTILPRAGRDARDLGEVRYARTARSTGSTWSASSCAQRFGPGAETQGLRVYTTFDPEMQKQAYEAVTKILDQPDGPVGSLVAVDDRRPGPGHGRRHRLRQQQGEPGAGQGRRRLGPPARARRSSRSPSPRSSRTGTRSSRASPPRPPRSSPASTPSEGKLWSPAELRQGRPRACSPSRRPPGGRPTPCTPAS